MKFLEKSENVSQSFFYIFILFGLIIRIAFSSISFHTGDLTSWVQIGQLIFYYDISPFVWWSQGPFNAIPIMAFQVINYIVLNNEYLLSISYHIPFIFGDILLLLVTFLIARDYFPKQKYTISLIVWFDSLVIFISSIWGQSDVWMVTLTLLSFYLLSKQKIWSGSIILGLAMTVKYLPIIIIPLVIQLFKSFKNVLKLSLAIFLTVIISFMTIYFINKFFYNDNNFFIYFLDRSGTIFGNFMPNFNGKQFISTGTSIWGELYQLRIFSSTDLEPFVKKWIFIYSLIYFGIIAILSIWIKNNKSHFDNQKNHFIFLNLAYILLVIPFMFLYPQSQLQRLMNFSVPLIFVFYYLNWNLTQLSLITALMVIANDIYAPGSLFKFETSNIFATILSLIVLFTIRFILTVESKNDLMLFCLTVFMCIFLYLSPTSNLHPLFTFINYGLLIIISIIATINFFKKVKNEQ